MNLLTRFSFILTFTVAVALAFVIVSVFTYKTQITQEIKQYEEYELQRVQQRMNELHGTLNDLLRRGQISNIRLEIFRLASDPALKCIALMDEHGTIIYSSRIDYEGKTFEEVPEIKTLYRPDNQRVHDASVSLNPDKDTLFAIYPVKSTQNKIDPFYPGHNELIALYDLKEGKQRIVYDEQQQIFMMLGWYLAVLVSFGGVLYLNISKRIRKIIRDTKAFSSGALTTRISLDGNDELAQIARTFDVMADAREKQHHLIVEQKEAFETIFAKSSDALFLLGNRALLDCNEAASALFGAQNKTELLHDHAALFSQNLECHDHAAQSFPELYTHALTEGSSHAECLCRRLDKSLFWAELVLTRIIIRNNEVVHIALRDITARKSLEAQNREQTKQLIIQNRFAQMGEMLSMIAHQWRQPLTSISSTVATLQVKMMLGHYDKAFFEKQLENISDFSQHLSNTINDFRDFFKENKERSTVKASRVIEEVLTILHSSLLAHTISVRKEYAFDEEILCFPNELKQVLLNILGNAQDILEERAPAEPAITIRTYQRGMFFYIDIADNGGGVPEKIMTEIFNPYFTTKGKLNGTGLGLYMSKRIVEEHFHGRLDVHNTSEGACFSIALPLQDPQSSAT